MNTAAQPQHHHHTTHPSATLAAPDEDVTPEPTGASAGDPDQGGSSDTPNKQPKERHSLTLDQRRALRRWANSQTVRPSHKACIEWFFSQYHQTISQSTVSHSLSPKYARLDGDPQLSGSRLRFGNWPDVEKLVLLWHQQTVASGRQPSNEELADKAKTIFQQLPRYRDEPAPEFSPGWIHRFKKRYGLLIRRQRRSGTGAMSGPEDIPYLVETVPKLLAVTAEISPAAIRDVVSRVVGVDPTLSTCARVRDEIIRRQENPPPPPPAGGHLTELEQSADIDMTGATYAPPPADGNEDPEVVLQNALRAMQQEEADAEAQAAADRERTAQIYQTAAAAALMATPTPAAARASIGVATQSGGTPQQQQQQQQQPQQTARPPELDLTPIRSDGPIATNDRPVRCPFCVNQRMLRTIKEAVEHMSTHVVV
ncbi:hypothetical protein MKZ38_003159 [Zalerion maritima]|uniref:HTH CENPB-type domain-containing protein n=1 Tax=Zalerion maritima TaxID=339359 RepID=A0AAD5WY81_9PEZI|nr:hypothetical protein MKZ38_003159 [Zalerion maritima]